LGLTRRQFFFATGITLGSPYLLASSQGTLPGTLLGLTTLNVRGEERSELFSLDLASGEADFQPLPNYQFGHSLEPLWNGRWLAIPYGDDQAPCLILSSTGQVLDQLSPPPDYGFGGHAVVIAGGTKVFLHYNPTQRSSKGGGYGEIVDLRTGKLEAKTETAIIHAHDMLMSTDGQIVVADDGVVDTAEDQPYLFRPIRPALHYFDQSLALMKIVDLNINGSLVHIAEDNHGTIIGAAEQYVRRNEAGHQEISRLLGASADGFFAQFDPEIYDLDVPVPGPLVTIDSAGHAKTAATRSGLQLEPFDTLFNPVTSITCCVFTESNSLVWRESQQPWQYQKLVDFGIRDPFGLANLGNTGLIAVNGFDQGVAILDSRDMSLVQFYDVPTHGTKHLSFSPVAVRPGKAG
jgi:hypothetical protein